ncbi:hypothetical protein GOODEAATRI_019671 [Goodea atripinnis]|uniref:Uncharacterized protein n=1 Tax=Goodea atripinnis TaxID=208336 RepID=A0ABV0NW20_9TELE
MRTKLSAALFLAAPDYFPVVEEGTKRLTTPKLHRRSRLTNSGAQRPAAEHLRGSIMGDFLYRKASSSVTGSSSRTHRCNRYPHFPQDAALKSVHLLESSWKNVSTFPIISSRNFITKIIPTPNLL